MRAFVVGPCWTRHLNTSVSGGDWLAMESVLWPQQSSRKAAQSQPSRKSHNILHSYGGRKVGIIYRRPRGSTSDRGANIGKMGLNMFLYFSSFKNRSNTSQKWVPRFPNKLCGIPSI